MNPQEVVAVRALRKAAIQSFGTPWILSLFLGITALIAFVAPKALPTDSILLIWLGTGGIAVVSVVYQITTGPWFVVIFARRHYSVLFSLIINSLIDVVLLTALAMPAISPEFIAEHGFIDVAFRVYMVLFLLTWAFVHVYLTLMENIFADILAKANLPTRIFPQFRTEKTDALQKLLPNNVRGPVRYIQAQDKYVQVATFNGNHLLPMPLSQAVSKIDPQSGMRVHRSLWISWEEVDRVVYENGNPRIIGKDGEVWPVSRKHVKQLKSELLDREKG